MSADLAVLGLKVDASGAITSLNTFEDSLKNIATSSAKTEHAVTSIKNAMSQFAAVLGVGIGLHELIEETTKAQYSFAQLEAGVKSTGMAAGFTAGQLREHAEALQQVTTFSHDAIEKTQAIFLLFQDLKGVQFEEATKAAADLAARMGTDVPDAARQLGKALEDPTTGLMMLRRAGVVFTADQQEVIKALAATGNLAGAQAMILDLLKEKVGGSAEAMRNTLGGALTGLKNDFNDLLEFTRAETGALVDFINAVDGVVHHVKDAKDGIVMFGAAIGAAGLLAALPKLQAAMAALYSVEAIGGAAALAAPFVAAALAAAALAAWIQDIRHNVRMLEDESDAQDQDRVRRTVAIQNARGAAARAAEAAAVKATADHNKAIQDLTDEIAKTEAKYKLIAENLPLYDKLLAAQAKLAALEDYEKAKQGWSDIGKALDKAAASAERYARAAGSALGISTSEGLGAAPGVSNALGAAAIAKGAASDDAEFKRREAAWAAYYQNVIAQSEHASKQIAETLTKDIQRAFASMFEEIFTGGADSFTRLWDTVKKGFFKMVADMVAADMTSQLAKSKLGDFMGMTPKAPNADGTVNPSDFTAFMAKAAPVVAELTIMAGLISSVGDATRKWNAETAALKAQLETLFQTIGDYTGSRSSTQKQLDEELATFNKLWNALDQQLSHGNISLNEFMVQQAALYDAYHAHVQAINDVAVATKAATAAAMVAAEWTRKYAQAFAEGNLRERDLRAQGMTAQADAEATFWRRAAEYADAVARGFDASFLAHMKATWDLEDQAIANAQKFSAAIIQTAAATKALAPGFLDANVEVAINNRSAAIIANIQNQIGATQLQLDAAKSVAAALKSAVSELQKAADSLKQFGAGLLTGSLSPLSPTALLDETRRQFEDAARKAAFGDAAAGQQVGTLGTSFLNASRAVNASGAGYAADFAQVQAMVAAAQGGVGGALDTATQALDENVKQTDLLTKMVAGLNNLIALQQQVAAQTIADFKSGARTGTWTGFASGGDFGGGVALVGEQGPELMNTGSARFFNAGQTAQMLGGSGQQDVVAAVREQTRAQLRVDAAGYSELLDAIKNLSERVDAVTTQIRRSAA